MIDPELFPDEATLPHPLRLFCFPHAGGGTSHFYRWRRYAPDSLAIIPARLPGRETRLQQMPLTSLSELATNIADTIRSHPPGPFALLGYSVGAYVAFQVAERLPRHGPWSPSSMVVVASQAPGTRRVAASVSELPDEEFIEHIHRKHGGIPSLIRRDPAWLRAVIPAIRADLRMLESFRLEPTEPLVCPLMAIGGIDDQHVQIDSLTGWGLVTRGQLTTRQFPGGHFFLYPDFNTAGSGAGGALPAELPAPLATVFDFVQRSSCAV